jgi:hypothetical protein
MTSTFSLARNQREKLRTPEMRGCTGNGVFYSGLLSFLEEGICGHPHTVSHLFGQSNLLGAALAAAK